MKHEAPEVLLEAIRKILAGDVHLSESMSSRMLRKMVGITKEAGAGPAEVLTDRELEVFQSIGLGKQTRQIAQDLKLSIKTVEAHREHIKKKLGLRTAAELVQHAFQWMQESTGAND